MSDDDKPSIAELRALIRQETSWPAVMVVLLDVAQAALDYQKAKKRAARTRSELYRRAFLDALSAESDAHDKEEIRCRDAFNAALAKVRE